MIYILYNPLSNNGRGFKDAKQIENRLKATENNSDNPIEFIDIMKIDKRNFYQGLKDDDEVILSGGDGTVNRFINSIYDIESGIRLRYFKSGSGNDFARDVGNSSENGMIELNPYIKNLPVITVKNNEYRFLNGIGYGLDGYCCEKSDEIKKKSGRKVNYIKVALRGLFFDYKPTDAKVTVDGKDYTFTNVLMAPVMKGRYYGGGVMIAPGQDRNSKAGELTLVVVHNLLKLRALTILPSTFRGKHVVHKDVITILNGHDISVEYANPAPLQIDGETVSDVKSYRAVSVCD